MTYPTQQSLFDGVKSEAAFDGRTIIPEFDAARLAGQYKRVYEVMLGNGFMTLDEIQAEILRTTGIHDSITGISARTRDFRKSKFGRHWVNSQRRGDARRGVWEYSLVEAGTI